MDYDALIVGGGIAGMQSALTLGDMGYRVLLVEKGAEHRRQNDSAEQGLPDAGLLKLHFHAQDGHHGPPSQHHGEMTSAEIDGIERDADGSFIARLRKKSTFVDPTACIGCGECERECTVAIADRFNFDLVASRAIHIAFPQARAQEGRDRERGNFLRAPTPVRAASRRMATCRWCAPVSTKEAFRLHMKDAPLPGSLSRLCYAPCEKQCTRALAEGKIEIRGAKRFMTDYYYDRHPVPEYDVPADRNGKRIAVVGSGPAGLTAAYFLARNGYVVTIFESAPEAGGVLRDATPPYRLPRAVLESATWTTSPRLGSRSGRGTDVASVADLKAQGFDSGVHSAPRDHEGERDRRPGERSRRRHRLAHVSEVGDRRR